MLSTILALMLASSWGPSGCASVEAPAIRSRLSVDDTPSLGEGYEWRLRQDDPDCRYLFKNGVQVGGWNKKHGIWRDLVNGEWKDPSDPPWVTVQNFGVSVDRLRSDNSYSYCGKKVDWKSVQAIFGADKLEDDSQKLRFTVIGSKDECDKVLTDLKIHPSLSPFSAKFAIQSYRPGSWPTQVYREAGNGPFYLSVQLPADSKGRGKELHAQRSYDGPEALAVALGEAVRRADPNYDPSKTPDLRKPLSPPTPPPAPEPHRDWVLWIVLGSLAYFLFSGPRK